MHSPTPTAMGGAHVWTVSRNVCACLAAALAGEFRAVVGEHGAEPRSASRRQQCAYGPPPIYVLHHVGFELCLLVPFHVIVVAPGAFDHIPLGCTRCLLASVAS